MISKYQRVLERIDSIGGKGSFKASTNSLNAWNVAFDLYNIENNKKLRKGCGSCQTKVYNWLKSHA